MCLLQFDRMSRESGDPEKLSALVAKMDRARRERAVVCASPEAVKSVMLKYVDLLQMAQAAPDLVRVRPSSLEGALAAKAQSLARDLRGRAIAADVLAKLLQMWSPAGHGVLLLDEVDQLLHPLRSELNFPIGPWSPLHLSPGRWDLPIFLTDGLFFATRGKVSVPGFKPTPATSALLDAIRTAIERGSVERAIQVIPHPVLLSTTFYESVLVPLLADWAMVFLRRVPALWDALRAPEPAAAAPVLQRHDSAPAAAVAESEDERRLAPMAEAAARAYIAGSSLDGREAAWLIANAPEEAMCYLNLARDWLLT